MRERLDIKEQLNRNTLASRRRLLIWAMSFFVVIGVFWNLKLTGVTMAGEAFCGHDEHQHDELCQKINLLCQMEETEGHAHDQKCYEMLICELEETSPHELDASCSEVQLICPEIEQILHEHTDDCYEKVYICDESVIHEHDVNCYETVETLVCEDDIHEHDETCIQITEHLICQLSTIHQHDETCQQLSDVVLCELDTGHLHDDSCYRTVEDSFVCGIEQTEGHVHDENCYIEVDEPVCLIEESSGHLHDENCYEVIQECLLEEHVHDVSCYSDLTADLENAEIWENSLPDLSSVTSSRWALIEIALSQVGVSESTANFEVDEQGIRRGITRYGQWYGHPYGDWSAMFVSFCLEYAGLYDVPVSSGVETMRLAWDELNLYEPVSHSSFERGNIIFFTDDLTTASRVGIITECSDTEITVIQGDVDESVVASTYAKDDLSLLGVGYLPERSTFALRELSDEPMKMIGQTISYSSTIFSNYNQFIIYTIHNNQPYAIDGYGQAVPLEIRDGQIYSSLADTDDLIWTFSSNGSAYIIRNISSNRYLHPFYNSSTDLNSITTGNWNTTIVNGSNGQLIRGAAYSKLNSSTMKFDSTQNSNNASLFQFGVVEQVTIYLDGTNGNLMSLAGSDVTSTQVLKGSTMTLPSQWKSPEKYSYVLKGWYDVKSGKYYKAGEEFVANEQTLFYADWIAATYDIGQMNEDVVNTVNTSAFITTSVFDYNSLFNVNSLSNNYSGGSSTRWTLIENGRVPLTNQQTLDFIFVDYDDTSNPGAISYPINRNQSNGVDYTIITKDLYDTRLKNLLFDKEVELPGKHYLGTGNYLFQYGDDPSDGDHYGYFYYDSQLNAASYHQSGGRFYVYDYLERTTDSAVNDSYADFLPLNSPYANTNGKSTGTYTYNGLHNEYNGTPHLLYDSKYRDENNSVNRVATNYWFGLVIEIEFYLPSVPGTVDADGSVANQSITGDEMKFEFSGDDDVWVLVDDQLILDIGGIHSQKSGSINFSTGDVVHEGVTTGSVNHLKPGSHKLTMYYLERGSSMSNFKMRFNLSTRYTMNLRKEDTLTAHLLNGAQFAFYTDEACTQPAQLWSSKLAHDHGASPANVFTVENGVSSIWGFAAGNTYYFKEIRGPDSLNGIPSKGIVKMVLNNKGNSEYTILPDHGELSVGYLVHGYKVNEDTQEAYLTISNTDAIESEPTEVYVEKVWSDTKDHSQDEVQVYLMANGITIQTVTLNRSNKWKYQWTNLPKTDANGIQVQYTVREAITPGYVPDVQVIDPPSSSSGSNAGNATGFSDGGVYLLQTRFGFIGASSNKLILESNEASALGSQSTLWTARVNSDGTIRLTNGLNHTIYYDNYTFGASTENKTYTNMSYQNQKLSCTLYHSGWSETLYPVDNDNVASNVIYNSVFYTVNTASQAMDITLRPLQKDEEVVQGEGNYYRITNIPSSQASISLKVKKQWDLGTIGHDLLYKELNIEMKLMADGQDSGLSCVVNLQNGWTCTLNNLPKYNHASAEIVYTIEEVNVPSGWHVEYGSIDSINGSLTDYETTVTNIYHMSVELPSTGGIGAYGYLVTGMTILLSSLWWYWKQKVKRERGSP